MSRREERNVLAALAERRQLDRDHAEPVVEVLAEAALRRSRPRGRCAWRATTRTSTAIDASPPTRSNLPLSSTRRSFACASRRMSPISSRKSVPPSAALELPSRARGGAGERALLVAEELALEQARRQRRAVHRDERPVARASCRWIARATSSLPVPVSPSDEHGDVASPRPARSCRRRAASPRSCRRSCRIPTRRRAASGGRDSLGGASTSRARSSRRARSSSTSKGFDR